MRIVNRIILGVIMGGVAANKKLRRDMKRAAGDLGINFFVPDFTYNQDNAAMIAAASYMAYCRRKNYKLAAKGDLDI